MSARNLILLLVFLFVALLVFRQFSYSPTELEVSKPKPKEAHKEIPAPHVTSKNAHTHDHPVPPNKQSKGPVTLNSSIESVTPGGVKRPDGVKRGETSAKKTGGPEVSKTERADAIGETKEFKMPEASEDASLPFLEVLDSEDSESKASALEELMTNSSGPGLAGLAMLCEELPEVCQTNRVAIFRAVNKLDSTEKEDFARESRGQYKSPFVKGLIADIETDAKAREQLADSPREIELPQPGAN